MRIGFVTGEYPPMRGGVGDFTHELARALAALGHDVVVITHAGAAHKAQERVRVWPVMRGWGWGAPGALARLARAERLEVVNLQYQAAAYGMGVPIHLTTLAWRVRREPFASAVTYHDLRVPYLFPKAGALRRQAVLALGRYADAAIVTNAEDESEWRQAVAAPRASVVPIGSNIAPCLPEHYDRDAWRAAHGLAPGDFVVGYFGFLSASKGAAVLIEALAALAAQGRPAHLLIAGDPLGSSDASNAAYAREVLARVSALALDERVHRLGFVDPQQVSAALAASDVVALPYRDGASLRRGSLMAALAHGCAIVSTHGPGAAVPGTPLVGAMDLVPPDDAPALAAALARLADDPARRAALGRRAAEAAQEFAWDRIALQTLRVYEQALARHGQGMA